MPASIDVVIPAHNNWELTSSCLSHLAAQTVAHQVIVVNNGSTDETSQRLREDWPHVDVIELERNYPFTQAVNKGVSAGRGAYVILLNNDVELRRDCLEQLSAPLEADPTVGSVAAVMLRPEEKAIDSVGITVDATLAGFARLQGLGPERARDQRPLLVGPEGAAATYRRCAWEQVGGLDEGISAYMEIVDLALKLRSAGWGVASAPDAIGVHLGSATFGRRSAAQRHLAGFSRGYLLRRYDVLRSRFAARALLTEILVSVADAALTRDCEALKGRMAGWRAARGKKHHPRPSRSVVDSTISMRESLVLRRSAARD